MQKKYKIVLVFIVFLLFSILKTIINVSYNNISRELLGIYLPNEWLIEQALSSLIFIILSNISFMLLIFGSFDLKNRFKQYKIIPYSSFVLITVSFLMLIKDLFSLIIITTTSEPLPFSLDLALLYSNLISFVPVIIPISFIIFGLSNRNRYGNYIISSGIMGVMGYITGTLHTIFIDPTQFIITNWSMMVYFAVDQLIWCILLILSSGFLLFFSMRINNRFFLIYTSLNFAKEFYNFYFRLKFVFNMELTYVILILVYISSVSLGILFAIKFFELGKRFKRGLRVFVSHSVDDFNRYRVGELVKFLESQKNISRVFYCESDLTGNIDEWMQKIVPRCQLLIFMSTEQSIISTDCLTELNLAKTNNIHIVPVLGVGLVWSDLKGLAIDREYGAIFDPMEFENFCNNVYEHIIKYKTTLESALMEEKRKKKSKTKNHRQYTP